VFFVCFISITYFIVITHSEAIQNILPVSRSLSLFYIISEQLPHTCHRGERFITCRSAWWAGKYWEGPKEGEVITAAAGRHSHNISQIRYRGQEENSLKAGDRQVWSFALSYSELLAAGGAPSDNTSGAVRTGIHR
jgi:hypothetical protein